MATPVPSDSRPHPSPRTSTVEPMARLTVAASGAAATGTRGSGRGASSRVWVRTRTTEATTRTSTPAAQAIPTWSRGLADIRSNLPRRPRPNVSEPPHQELNTRFMCRRWRLGHQAQRVSRTRRISPIARLEAPSARVGRAINTLVTGRSSSLVPSRGLRRHQRRDHTLHWP